MYGGTLFLHVPIRVDRWRTDNFSFSFFFFPLLFSCLPALAARGADVHLVLYLGRCGGYVRRYNTYM